MKSAFISLFFFLLSGCAVYTEKRSESLSQAVFATSDSIAFARFDLASKYSKQAERLAYPPKNKIEISPVYTSPSSQKTSGKKDARIFVKINDDLKKNDAPIVSSEFDNQSEVPVLRLVIPENLKHTKLLIENSEEWNELIKTKNFYNQLEKDNQNLKRLAEDIDAELQKQMVMNNKMVQDLNIMQKKLLEKDLAILKRNIVIFVMAVLMGGGVYLRMKGIL